MKRLVIGSRGSKLALWQAEWVSARLRALSSPIETRIETIKTSGDRLHDKPLALIGATFACASAERIATRFWSAAVW